MVPTKQTKRSGDAEAKKRRIPHRFTEEEDALLAKCVANATEIDWYQISKQFKDRTSRQLRERWNLYLSPDINHGTWTEEEDKTLLFCVNRIGKHWSRMGSFLPKRTPMSIKNRWNVHLKKNVVFNSDGDYEFIGPDTEESIQKHQVRNAVTLMRHREAKEVYNKVSKSKQEASNELSEQYAINSFLVKSTIPILPKPMHTICLF